MQAGNGASSIAAPVDLVYKQLKQPAKDLSYYELVSAAEVLKGAQIDDSDLDHAVVTLTSANAALLACVHATAVAAEEGE